MALDLNTLATQVSDDKLDKKPGGKGRAPSVPDEQNPFLGDNGLLMVTYGAEASAKSMTVPNADARELYGLINRSAQKLGKGVAVQFKGTKGQRLDYINFAAEGAPADVKWAQVTADGEGWEAYQGRSIKVIWKAKDRKQVRRGNGNGDEAATQTDQNLSE